MKDFIRSIVTSFFTPQRVFIALMLAVILWLFPFTRQKTQVVQPIENGVILIESDPPLCRSPWTLLCRTM